MSQECGIHDQSAIDALTDADIHNRYGIPARPKHDEGSEDLRVKRIKSLKSAGWTSEQITALFAREKEEAAEKAKAKREQRKVKRGRRHCD